MQVKRNKYYLITIYKLKSFESFINLLENNLINTEIIGMIEQNMIGK